MPSLARSQQTPQREHRGGQFEPFLLLLTVCKGTKYFRSHTAAAALKEGPISEWCLSLPPQQGCRWPWHTAGMGGTKGLNDAQTQFPKLQRKTQAWNLVSHSCTSVWLLHHFHWGLEEVEWHFVLPSWAVMTDLYLIITFTLKAGPFQHTGLDRFKKRRWR